MKEDKPLVKLLPLIETIRAKRYTTIQEILIWDCYIENDDMVALVSYNLYFTSSLIIWVKHKTNLGINIPHIYQTNLILRTNRLILGKIYKVSSKVFKSNSEWLLWWCMWETDRLVTLNWKWINVDTLFGLLTCISMVTEMTVNFWLPLTPDFYSFRIIFKEGKHFMHHLLYWV